MTPCDEGVWPASPGRTWQAVDPMTYGATSDPRDRSARAGRPGRGGAAPTPGTTPWDAPDADHTGREWLRSTGDDPQPWPERRVTRDAEATGWPDADPESRAPTTVKGRDVPSGWPEPPPITPGRRRVPYWPPLPTGRSWRNVPARRHPRSPRPGESWRVAPSAAGASRRRRVNGSACWSRRRPERRHLRSASTCPHQHRPANGCWSTRVRGPSSRPSWRVRSSAAPARCAASTSRSRTVSECS